MLGFSLTMLLSLLYDGILEENILKYSIENHSLHYMNNCQVYFQFSFLFFYPFFGSRVENFCIQNFASRSDTIFCGVFDGHGPFGHMVAKKVRDSLPLKLCEQWRANSSSINSPQQNGSAHGSMNSVQIASIDDQWGESFDVDENGKLPEAFSSLKQSFLKAFKLMDIELKLHPSIDCFCSGTTAVTVLKQVLCYVISV